MNDLLASKGTKPRTGSVVRCQQCGTDFYWKQAPSQSPRKFCSSACHSRSMVRARSFRCSVCSKEYTRPPSQVKLRGTKYCSMPCSWRDARVRQSGPLSSSWKGGVSAVNRRIRSSADFKHWREAVFKRDNWTCQKCGKRGGVSLHPHHIKPFADWPALRFEVSNGMTLCADPCHRDEHRRSSNRKNGRNWRRDQTALPL